MVRSVARQCGASRTMQATRCPSFETRLRRSSGRGEIFLARSFPRKRESSSALLCISWVPACARTSGEQQFFRFNFQTAKRQRPVFSDVGASSFLFPSPLKSEGAERRQSHRQSIRTAAVEACEACRRGRRAMASLVASKDRHARAQRRSTGGDFGPWDRASGRDRDSKKSHRSGGFPAFTSLPSSHQRQPHLVGADSDPWPPGDGLRGTSAGAAPAGAGLPRFRPR
jgi:hypothetical protein